MTEQHEDATAQTGDAAAAKRSTSALDGTLPYAPRSLVLVRDPDDGGAWAALSGELTALTEAGEREAAHRLAQPSIGDVSLRPALVGFYLREAAGRRGARLLLRWLRADGQKGAERLFAEEAIPAVESWAHFRLLRHGRALGIAQREVASLTGADADDRGAETGRRARVWGQTLEAIRTSALRRGSLRLALNFHELAERLERAHPGSHPEPQRAEAAMTAVAFLLEQHHEHGLPATVARYLARSLGHREGDSHAGYAEMAMDLGVRPEHLDAALALADRFGFEGRVRARIASLKERCFQGSWQVRRTVQRGMLVVLWIVIVGVVMLGFTLLVHLVTRT